ALSVYSADIDGDSDMDVLSASDYSNEIAWYENDGSQNFTTHVITTEMDLPCSVYAADVDSDSDMDVLSASPGDDKIAWYENDGSQNFATHVITENADWAWCVYAVDVDGDTDIDVLSASWADDKIAWYENQGATKIVRGNKLGSPLQFHLYNNYPNPFNPSTNIKYSISNIGWVNLIIYNSIGKKIKTMVNEVQNPGVHTINWDGTNDSGHKVSSGTYFYNLKVDNAFKSKHMILLK
ncbi:VCBS repeat-containing protein, partial [candidate division KSB1 bacterium]|nr:VCBS repeat-containing protein [candidate division KSB1 bacterium]